ncbi:hypothetical protein EX30DRAFT_310914 [Ascodesmis nigricans]|uniref:Histone deacetylase n=1 Tax=Ascodesmis nigricans TaxID=341454 RepID=A0A4S2MRQ1_9PEZI|nr:hypothetical protein EX30DRAFT_310914 [Ascodesmis nigricans]
MPNEGEDARLVTSEGHQRKRINPLPISSLKTGLCYDVRMRYHATVDAEDMHPEDPRRIYEIYKALCQAGLVDDPEFTGVKRKGDLMHRIDAREVSKEEAMLVHTPAHWDFLDKTQEADLEELQMLTMEGDSVYFNALSFFCSRLSCGGAIETCKAVMSGQVKNAIAVIRPPGHHAEPDQAMGFCLFNNVCVATKVLQRDFPSCKKVMILDWCGSLGNGTQTAFYDDPSVLYMSIHRYQGGNFYPVGPAGNLDYCGTGAAIGMNVNVPWENGGMGDGDYMFAFQQLIMPIALEFNPDLVIVSAGFDAAAGDALGGCYVTPGGYAHMTHMLMSLAGGKVVVCLEGGYNLQSISNSALAVAKVLMGEPPERMHQGNVASKSAVRVVHQCISYQSRFWRSLRSCAPIHATQLDFPEDVIRSYQSSQLSKKHRMFPLAILRDELSPSFENEVIATPEYYEKDTIVLLVHDPPLVTAQPDPHTNRIALHTAFLVDAGSMIVDWAVEKGFGLIDINIPLEITGDDENVYNATLSTEALCLYIWDNYIEPNDFKNVILMSIGQAQSGLTHLLVHRDCRERVRAIAEFLGENNPIKAVSSNIIDEYLPEWYYNHSLIFVSSEHDVWERTRKTKRKFGDLRRSAEAELVDVVRSAMGQVKEYMDEALAEE